MFEDLFDRLDKFFFDERFDIRTPRSTINKTTDNYEIRMEVPGYEKGDIDLYVQDGTLTMIAHHEEKKEEKKKEDKKKEDEKTEPKPTSSSVIEKKEGSKEMAEFKGTYSRSEMRHQIALPMDADVNNVSVDLENGILIIKIPIMEKYKPRRITIK